MLGVQQEDVRRPEDAYRGCEQAGRMEVVACTGGSRREQ